MSAAIHHRDPTRQVPSSVRRLASLAVLSMLTLGMSAAPAASAAWTLRDLGTLGGSYSEALAVDGNIVVGWAHVPGNATHAFAYDLATSTMRDLGTLGGTHSIAFGVSGDIVVGYAFTDGNAGAHAFAYDLSASTMRDLGTLGGGIGIGYQVDGDVVVGHAATAGNAASRAFAYDLTGSTMRDLGSLGGSDSRAVAVRGDVVVGSAWTNAQAIPHAFAYDLTGSTMRDLGTLGGGKSQALAVSGDVVVGGAETASYAFGSPVEHAFAYDLSGSTMRDLGTLGGPHSRAGAISGDVVVGRSLTGDSTVHAFAYDLTGSTMRDLGTLGGNVSEALAIDGDLVVGHGYTPGYAALHAFAYDLTGSTMEDLGTLGGIHSRAVAVSGDVIVGQSYTPGNTAFHAVAWTLPTTPSNLPPTLELPDDLTVEGNTTGGAHVTYPGMAATDPEDGDLSDDVECNPVSGSFFALGGPHTVTCEVTDSGGLDTTETFEVTVVDTTDPTIAFLGQSPPPNADGWNTTDVTLDWHCSDIVGIDAAESTASVTLTGEGANQSATGRCVDTSDNDATHTVTGIDVDKTAPGMVFVRRTLPNIYGWNNTDVTVEWRCTDGSSGVPASAVETTISTEAADQTAEGRCTDGAGHTAAAYIGEISVDKTPPTTTITTPSGAILLRVAGMITGTTSDDLSGAQRVTLTFRDLLGDYHTRVAECTLCTAHGGVWSLSTESLPIGLLTLTAVTTDVAGNDSAAAGPVNIIVI